MTKIEINQHINNIYIALKNYQIHNALKELSILVELSSSWDLHEEFNRMDLEYSYMLKYFSSGAEDSSRGSIYNSFVNRLYSLTDKTKCYLLSSQDYTLYYCVRKSRINISNVLSEYITIIDSVNIYNEIENKDIDKINTLIQNKERCEIKLFNSIWTSFPIKSNDIDNINYFLSNENVPQYSKVLIISSILLSLLEYYDESLLITLIRFYLLKKTGLSITALCAAVIILFIHRERIKTSILINQVIDELCEIDTFENDFKTIIFLLVRSKNTEKLTKRVEDDLMPNLMKAYPKVFDKIKNDTSLDLADLESNPEWKDLIDDNILSKKIDELNKLQMEGADVFIGTFSQLKAFPFFNEVSNWFMPFYKEHSLLNNIFSDNENALINIIAESKFFCDSDKYSFVASIASVPISQRNLMLSQFNEQNSAIEEIKKARLDSQSQMREDIANIYIQNIYRFFKLHPRKQEFIDPFKNDFDISILDIITSKIDITDSIEILANFYLKNNYFHKALKYFKILNSKKHISPIYNQKIGFCYQSLEKYHEAIEYYNKYALLSNNDLWNLRHLAACYRAIKEPQNALKYYKEAVELAPENISLSLNIGHCLLEIDDYQEALKYYFKVNYVEPNSLRSLRPIAWCLFALGNYEQSKKYYNKIIESQPNSTDYLNYGHLLFAVGDIPNAISMYNKSISFNNESMDNFVKKYNSDESILLKFGIKKSDISLLLDTLLYQNDV